MSEVYDLNRPYDIRFIENQTKINSFMAVSLSGGEYFKYIKNPSLELTKFAIRVNGSCIRFIDENDRDEELCELAAIHEAPIDILPHKTKKICRIVEFVEKYRVSKSRVSYTGRVHTPKDIVINGEMTNFSRRATAYQLIDIPSFMRYWIDYGMPFPDRDIGKSFSSFVNIFEDGTYLSTYDSATSVDGFENPKIRYNESYLYKKNGSVNTNYAESVIKENPEIFIEIQDKVPHLTRLAIHSGLGFQHYDLIHENVKDEFRYYLISKGSYQTYRKEDEEFFSRVYSEDPSLAIKDIISIYNRQKYRLSLYSHRTAHKEVLRNPSFIIECVSRMRKDSNASYKEIYSFLRIEGFFDQFSERQKEELLSSLKELRHYLNI